MWLRAGTLLPIGIAVGACGPAAQPRVAPETPEPVPVRAEVAEEPDEKIGEIEAPVPEAPVPPPVAGEDYAMTPVTPFARAVTDLVFDVLEGEPVETELPIERSAADVEPLELGRGVTDVPEDLSVMGFLAELDFTVAPDSPVGRITSQVFLGAGGMRVVGLGYAPGREDGDLHPTMAGFSIVAKRILASVREEDRSLLERLLPRELDRPWIGEDLYRELTTGYRVGVLDPDRRAELGEAEPVSYQLDRLVVFLRGGDGEIYSAELDVDVGWDGDLELDPRPLVRFEKAGFR